MLSKEFLRFWRAGAVSGLGSYITLFALQALVVLTLHGTASDVGWLNAARWLPYLVLGLVVGAVVDRRQRLPLLIGTDVAQATLLLTIPVLWWLDILTLPALTLIVMAYGTASVVNGAAEMSVMPRLLEGRYLQQGHARIDGADAVASTAGPALGGALVSAVGAPVAVVVDSLTYIYSAMTLRRISLDEPPPRSGLTASRLLLDVVDGLRWIYRGSSLLALAVMTHVWFAGNAIIGVVLAPYALRSLDLSAFQFGIAGATGGLGALVGAAVTTWVGRRLGTGRTIIAAHLITTIAVVLLWFAAEPTSSLGSLGVLMAGQCLYGMAIGVSNSHEMSYRQLITPDELQARTNITLRSLNRAVIVVVAPIAGVLADAWGIRPMLLLAAAIFALVVVGLAATPFRNVRAPV